MKNNGNKALKEWVNADTSVKQNGRVSGLARHLKLSQPAVTKIINDASGIRFEHIQGIIDYTGISAKDLLPEYYALFEKNLEDKEKKLKEAINQHKKDAINQFKIIMYDIENMQ